MPQTLAQKLAQISTREADMPYSNFSLQTAVTQFNLKYLGSDLVFPTTLPPLPAEAERAIPFLTRLLERDVDLARCSQTDKAKSEFMTAPVLATLRQIHKVGVHSGVPFNVSPMENLQGDCDFLITLSDEIEIIEAPILIVVQAKKSVMSEGVGECVAQMVAAQRFNQQAGLPPLAIFGCVTNGFAWRFLKLANDTVVGDNAMEYPLKPTKILMQRLYYTVTDGIMV